MPRASKVEIYLDRVLEVKALEQAVKDEGETPERRSALRLAYAARQIAYSKLTGSEIGRAQRVLRDGGNG